MGIANLFDRSTLPGTQGTMYLFVDEIRDSYPRYLFTMDPLLQRRDGVRHLNLMEFIAGGGDLVGTE